MNYKLRREDENGELRTLISHKLESRRLSLVPLEPRLLQLAIEDYGKMQRDLGLRVTNMFLDEELEYSMKVRLRKVLEDVENFLWTTNWAIINKALNEIIGFIMIKGYPNEVGEVIIGYGIDEKYRKNGYATEAVERLIKWIFENQKVKYVIADTEKNNIPSHKVLEKAGANKYKETDELLWWKIERKSII